MKRGFAVVAVVALLALAGCSGGSTGGATTAPNGGDSGGQATTAAATTAASTTAAASALAEQSWTYENETVAFQRLYQQHQWTLANASSYQFSRDIVSNTGGETDATIAVDHEAERANLTIASSSGAEDATQIQETYVGDGYVYSKSGTADDPRYSRQNESLTAEEFDRFTAGQSRIQVGGGVPAAMEWAYVGNEDGAYVFEADSIAASERTSFDADNVTSISGRLAVAPEGYVSELAISLTVARDGGTESAEVLVETVGVNETTVSEPSWTSEATSASV